MDSQVAVKAVIIGPSGKAIHAGQWFASPKALGYYGIKPAIKQRSIEIALG